MATTVATETTTSSLDLDTVAQSAIGDDNDGNHSYNNYNDDHDDGDSQDAPHTSRTNSISAISGNGPRSSPSIATLTNFHTATNASSKVGKSSLRSRWLVLAMACVVMTGSYYAYDIPSALHQQLQDYMPPSPHFETNFNLLYTIYSLPNVILPLFGGNIVDRYGAPFCLTLFTTFTFSGSLILSLGVAHKSWHVMYLGRLVFGLGGESLCVAQSTILSEWFEGKEVAFAMGVGLAVSRLGSIWNNVMSPKVANSGKGGLVGAFWLGSVLNLGSLVIAAGIVLIDRRATKQIRRKIGGASATNDLTVALLEEDDGDGEGILEVQQTAGEVRGNERDGGTAHACENVEAVHISDIRKFGPLFWLLSISCFVVYGCVLPFNNVASGILLERNFFTSSPESCHLEYSNQCTLGYLQNGSNPSLDNAGGQCSISSTQAPVLPTSVNFTRSDSNRSSTWEESSYLYSSLRPTDVDCGDPFWLEACTSDYCTKQNDSTEHAGRVMSIPYLISAISSPALGHLVDNIGRRAKIASLASLILFIVHLTMAFSTSSPTIPLFFQGIAYSLYAAVIWPSVPLTVSKIYTGTAFGVITSIQNIGLALFPLIIAAIYNSSGMRYIPNVEIFFSSLAAIGLAVGLIMNRVDRRLGGKLNAVSHGLVESQEEASEQIREPDDDFLGVHDEYFSPLM